MRLGFIGLGAMGSRMAGRLLAAHHDVVVYNRTPERTRPLEQRGAMVAATLRELATSRQNTIGLEHHLLHRGVVRDAREHDVDAGCELSRSRRHRRPA